MGFVEWEPLDLPDHLILELGHLEYVVRVLIKFPRTVLLKIVIDIAERNRNMTSFGIEPGRTPNIRKVEDDLRFLD